MTSDIADIGLTVFKKAADVWRAGRNESLIDFTRPTRVEPIVLVDADCIHMDALPDVQQSLLAMFSGFYLQAVAVMTNVGNVSVQKSLDKLSPNRDVIDNAFNSAGVMLAAESYKDRLPMYGAKQKGRALEDTTPGAVPKDSLTSAKELTNLSVGKLLMVEITDGKNKAVVPVNVRLIASQVPSKTLVHILQVDGEDHTATERYHGWRSGRLGFIKDLIFCQDLIDAHKRNLNMDKDGVYTTMSKRANQNAISAILTQNPSVATASNMVVMSTRTAAELELGMSGKLSDFRAREKMLAPTTIMIMAVIDPTYDRVTFYHRGIAQDTELGVRDLKASNKSGPDVGDILKAYQIGTTPSL